MPLLVARVDNKLIHGQVALGWGESLQLDEFIVADDQAAQYDDLKAIFSSVASSYVKAVSFVGPKESPKLLAERLNCPKNPKIMIIFRNVAGAKAAVEAGLALTSLNLGNHMISSKSAESFRLSPFFVVEKDDLDRLKTLSAGGISCYLQILPDSPKILFDPAKF
jgi:mannose/fructose/N-acetylgalactosamine-specific phosphotransferase system component IIB